MEPVVLTERGDALVNENSQITDECKLRLCLGIHNTCVDSGGVFNKWPVSIEQEVVRCSSCGQWFIIPKEVDTYGKLRKHCAAGIKLTKKRVSVSQQLAIK